MARLVTEASSNATYLCGLSGSVVVSVMTYAHESPTGARGGGDGDVRWVPRVLRLVEALELVDVAPVVRHGDARALTGVVRGATTDGDEAVAVVLLVEAHSVHDVVVLGVRLDLVVHDDLEAVVLHRLDDLLDDVRAAQTRGHHQGLLEAQLERFRPDELVTARPEQSAGERVELLDGERLEKFVYLHGGPFGTGNLPAER